MRQRIALAVILLSALAATVAVAKERPITIRAGNLVLRVTGHFDPSRLPARGRAPIALTVAGTIGTADHSHPPAIEGATVDVDRSAAIDARGLPTCGRRRLEARTSAEAAAVCGAAVVGEGTAEVEVLFPEQSPIIARSRLLAFNGGVGGAETTIYVHAYITRPVRSAVVTAVKIEPHPEGPFGLRADLAVPPIVNGNGSIVGFSLHFPKREVGHGQGRHPYLALGCRGSHILSRVAAVFSGGQLLKGTLFRQCTPI